MISDFEIFFSSFSKKFELGLLTLENVIHSTSSAEGEKRGTVLLLLYVERIMKHPDSEFCDHCRSAG